MIRTPEEMRALIQDLEFSAWTLGALGTLFESGLVEWLCEPCSIDELAARCPALPRGHIERCLAVAAAAGVIVSEGGRHRLAEGALPFSQPPMRGALQGDIRTQLMQVLALLDRPKNGWQHADPALLQSQGDASSMLAMMMKGKLVPTLGDLAARLERPGARFLDIGVGVGALAIAMCRAFPQLAIVGLDPYEAPLAIARQNIARAKLAERIELRQAGVEALRDEQAFELVWLPSFFVPVPALTAAATRIHAALRPGGWIVCATGGSGGDERQRSVWSLINETWGGAAFSPPEAEAFLQKAGFSSIRTLPGPVGPSALVVGQR